jgi:hypothetical protein
MNRSIVLLSYRCFMSDAHYFCEYDIEELLFKEKTLVNFMSKCVNFFLIKFQYSCGSRSFKIANSRA